MVFILIKKNCFGARIHGNNITKVDVIPSERFFSQDIIFQFVIEVKTDQMIVIALGDMDNIGVSHKSDQAKSCEYAALLFIYRPPFDFVVLGK